VILELASLFLQSSTAFEEFNSSINQLAHEYLESDKLDYFGLAPKAQLGGHRDLGVMNIGTKLSSFILEKVSRHLCSKVTSSNLTESLTHKTRKYTCIEDAVLNTTMCFENNSENKRKGLATREYCMSMNEDNSSWGPNNTPSVNFRNVLTPVYQECGGPGSLCLMKLIKLSLKEVEIPSPVVYKLLDNSLDLRKKEFEDLRTVKREC